MQRIAVLAFLAPQGASGLTSAPAPARAGGAWMCQNSELVALYEQQKTAIAARKEKAINSAGNLATLGSVRDALSLGRPPRLDPHDIDVITISDGRITAEALASLLSHEACAVHVRGFCRIDECRRIESSLANEALYSNWAINRMSEKDGVASEVDKVGVVASEAVDSWEQFCEYLAPADGGLERRLEVAAECNPLGRLLEQLDAAYEHGCRRDQLGAWSMPVGTIRRMRSSKGLVHADTATLLSRNAGEFSANLYIRTPPATSNGSSKGALNIYPARQYVGDGGILGATSPALLADLQSLAKRQAEGFRGEAQAYLRSALPLRRRLELRDGDLVLINTGRFHEVEAYGDDGGDGYRLSGQSWLSYRQGKPLLLWV